MLGKLCNLRLVAPAISNREAEYIKDNEPEFVRCLKQSNLYMIVQRPEIIFSDIGYLSESNQLEFEIQLKNSGIKSKGKFCIDEIFENNEDITFKLYRNDKFSWIFFQLPDNRYYRMTPEMLWFYKSRGKAVSGFDNYRDFTQFYLHYIGISKIEDSFERLIVKPHDKRLKVLSNEDAFNNNSALNDEIFFLFFKVSSMDLQTIETVDDFERLAQGDLLSTTEDIRIISDAEKAFIYFMESKYNNVLYKKYPLSRDGLYNQGFDSYTYQIQEDITLHSEKNIFNCRFGVENSGAADFIYVCGDKATLLKASNC